MNTKVYLLPLAIVAVLIQEYESTTVNAAQKGLSQTYAIFELTASDSGTLGAASAAITTPGSTTTEVFLESDWSSAAPTQSIALYGLTAASNYVVTLTTATSGGSPISPNPEISFCTAANPLTGLAVDSEGTTEDAIKIKWDSVTSAKYKVYLDNEEIDGDVAAGSSDFTFDATTLAGKSVTLDSEKAQTCKVEVVLTVTGCTNGVVMTSDEIECGVTGAAGSGTTCKSSAKMFYPALTFIAVIFSMTTL